MNPKIIKKASSGEEKAFQKILYVKVLLNGSALPLLLAEVLSEKQNPVL